MLDAVMKDSLRNQLATRRTRLQDIQAEVGEAADLVHLLKEVDSALDRLGQDGFGMCEFCGDPMGDSFLTANPMTSYCLCDLTPKQQDALGRDLSLAGRIQAGLLPEQNASFAGWETHYRYLPAGPVSGDYVDLVNQEDTKNLFLLLGDVSGKGVAASFLMAHLNALFRSLIQMGLPIKTLVERANGIFKESTTSTHYATLVAAKADPLGGVEICNAGHFSPFLLQGNRVTPVDSTGFPVGLFDRSPYDVVRIRLARGDTMFLYTDGLTEARNARGEEYGETRLREVLRGNTDLSPVQLADVALNDQQAFSGEVSRSDDLTVLVLRRTG